MAEAFMQLRVVLSEETKRKAKSILVRQGMTIPQWVRLQIEALADEYDEYTPRKRQGEDGR